MAKEIIQNNRIGFKSYSDKLKDPRWQRKRLEIFQRDDFTCQATACHSKHKTLHVHHLIYSKGKDPWDIDNKCLLTLCEDCHNELENDQDEQIERLINAFRVGLKYSWIRECCIDVFESSSDLDSLIYLLWETQNDEERVIELLKSINHG